MKRILIILLSALSIAQLVCQIASAQENVVLQDNFIPGLIIDRPVRIMNWPTGNYDAKGKPVEFEGVRQFATIQGIKALILYAEFANTNEAHRAVEYYSKSHAEIFYPGLWSGAQNNSIGDESWYGDSSISGNAILFRSGRICVLVSCDGKGDKEKQNQVAELLAKPIEDKIKTGGRVILSYEDQSMLPAQVTLKPEALEVSPGVLTAFVRLPDGYPATNIISATCDGAPSEKMMPNDDGTEMIIKFRRKDIEAALAQWGGSLDTQFVVRGVWKGGTRTLDFHGVAKIKKIVGGKSK